MRNRVALPGVQRSTMAVLMLSVFTVSLGFGILLPALPFEVERLLGAGGDATQVSRSTGLLTGLYTLSLFLFASLWGRLSDRSGRRTILLIGLLGFSASSMTFAFIDGLAAMYAERFLSGMFAAAVTPVALAAASDLAASETERARRLTFVSIAGVGGFLLGPMIGVIVARIAAFLFPVMANVGTLAIPLAGTALLALLVSIAVLFTIHGKTGKKKSAPVRTARWLRRSLARSSQDCLPWHSSSRREWAYSRLAWHCVQSRSSG